MLSALRRSAQRPRVVAAAACASSSQAPPWRLAERELQQQNVRLRDVSTGADYVALVARLEAEQRAASRAAVGVRRSASPPLGEATYSVLIRSAVEAGDVAAGARLLERMKARSPERPRRRAYAPLLAAHSLDASARERVDDLWQDMVRDDVALSEADYACLFRSRLAGPPAGVDEVLERLGRDAGVFAIASRTAAAMARDADAAPGWSATYERVGADGTTRFGALKRLALDGADRAQLRAAVLRAAGRRGGAQRERLEAFAEAFDRRCAAADAKNPPGVRVALDGANVAWYGRNFRGGDFDHGQLDRAMGALPAFFGGRVDPVLVLPRKHARASRLSGDARRLVDAWRREPHLLTTVPPGSDDDWYWMLASLSVASRGCDFAVSNDAARDHHFMHLAPLPFQRWKRRHVLRFAFRRDAAGAPAAFALDEPPTFSAELQRLETASHVAWLAPLADAPGVWLALARPKN